jgi:hypothetical protein
MASPPHDPRRLQKNKVGSERSHPGGGPRSPLGSRARPQLGAVPHGLHALAASAVCTTENAAVTFYPVADDSTPAMCAARSQQVHRAFKAVEHVRCTRHHHLECLVVVVPAHLAPCHSASPPCSAIRASVPVKIGGIASRSSATTPCGLGLRWHDEFVSIPSARAGGRVLGDGNRSSLHGPASRSP